jgi:hypothetical protein
VSGRSGSRIQRPAANAVLTTVVDAQGRSWTPKCPRSSSGLIRRTAVDSCGPGRSPEKRKADYSAAISAASDAWCTAEFDLTGTSQQPRFGRLGMSPSNRRKHWSPDLFTHQSYQLLTSSVAHGWNIKIVRSIGSSYCQVNAPPEKIRLVAIAHSNCLIWYR